MISALGTEDQFPALTKDVRFRGETFRSVVVVMVSELMLHLRNVEPAVIIREEPALQVCSHQPIIQSKTLN